MSSIKERCIKEIVRERDRLKAEVNRYRLLVAARQFKIQKLEKEIQELKRGLNRFRSDKRLKKRNMVSLSANLIDRDVPYSGLIENVSEQGMHVRLTPSNTAKNLPINSQISVEFKVSSRQAFLLSCKKRWSCNTPPHGIVKSLGLEITEPPPEYKNFVKTLS